MRRRHFLQSSALLSSSLLIPQFSLAMPRDKQLRIACQHYTWFTYYRREGKEWEKDLDEATAAMQAAGLSGYEPSFRDPEHVADLEAALGKEKLWASSTYVNSLLHEADEVEKSQQEVLAIAKAAKKMGIKIIVTNPRPIAWGQVEDKSDQQLMIQAKALNQLGAELRKLGIQLAYHNHDMEMRQSAREFHHMMLNTDPENVHLCLDAHWVYRGAGNSQVALFDIVKLYADRIVELHLRQSEQGIWSEVYGDGDIDYARLAEALLSRGLKPHLVLEQAIEKGTPHTLDTVTALRKSLANVQAVFSDFAD